MSAHVVTVEIEGRTHRIPDIWIAARSRTREMEGMDHQAALVQACLDWHDQAMTEEGRDVAAVPDHERWYPTWQGVSKRCARWPKCAVVLETGDDVWRDCVTGLTICRSHEKPTAPGPRAGGG